MPSPPSQRLLRGLPRTAATAVVVAAVIGTGVFIKARIMTCNVGSPGLVLTAWVVAGLLSLAGALTYAELGAMMPYSGGEYSYLGAAYGRKWAFLNGWMRTFIDKGGSQAALGIGCVIFLNDLARGALSATAVRWLPVAFIVSVTLVNLASVRRGGQIATVLTIIKVGLVLTVGVGAFWLAQGSWGHFMMSGADATCADVPETARFGITGFGAAMLGALWGYDGWNQITQAGGEVSNPQRNIPRALIGGTILIIILYLFANAAYFYVLTPEAVASVSESTSVAAEVASRFLGPAAVGVMAAGLTASSLGALHTTVLSGSRVTYAMARDGFLPKTLARVNPRTHVPSASVVMHGTWASILALTGSYDTLTNYAIFGSWIFYGMTGAAVFVLRRKWPDVERPYKTWGYPVVPALFLMVTAFLLITNIVAAPVQALAGIGLILLGLPVYFYYARRAGVETEWRPPADE